MLIQIKNLDFKYFGYSEKIFDNISFSFDTNWKTALIGRNGIGKSTLFKILLNQLEYNGSIIAPIDFSMFPFPISDENILVADIFEQIAINCKLWKLKRELNLLQLDDDIIYRPFNTLSKGEQTKVQLSILFSIDNNFLLIDEPTNHLDYLGREIVSKYLKSKKGFILISHDRDFINNCVDHIIAFNKNTIDVQTGNFESWQKNKEREDIFEIREHKKHKKEIKKLNSAVKQKSSWSNLTEKTKTKNTKSGMRADKGYIGHKSAKLMKTAKNLERRQQRKLKEKEKLLKNIDKANDLKLNCLNHYKDKLIEISNLSYSINNKVILSNINLSLKTGECLAIQGGNGSGKSTLIKIILGEIKSYNGSVSLAPNLKISYVRQDSNSLIGSMKDWILANSIDETLFRTILHYLNFPSEQFELNMENYSAGQRKKVLLATSLSQEAHVFIWDEPLNYIDVLSRIQIENLILSYKPTIIVIEHDKKFIENIASKCISIT